MCGRMSHDGLAWYAKNLWKSAGSVGVKLSAQCAKEQAGCFYSPTDLSDKHRCHAGCLYQKHGLHRCARMGLFTDSLLLLRCLQLGFDAPPAQRIATDFFAGGELCGRMSHDGLAWYAKNLWKSAGSVGVKLSAQCAKEQAGCFYSPTDLSDKHRCHADWWGVKWLSSL